MKKILTITLLLLVAISMLVSACAPAATEAPVVKETEAQAPAADTETTAKKVFRVAENQEYDTLNPFTSQMVGGFQWTWCEGLVISNNKNSYIPVLAEEIPTYENGGIVDREDGKIDMTWNLRKGVKWHDGVDFTSADVCFTYDWLVSENASMVYNQNEYMNISNCEEVDDTTVVFTWDVPYAPYATLFDALLPKHLLEGTDVPTNNDYNLHPIGTGPFKFEEWKAGEYVRSVKNPDYWRGSEYPKIDEFIVYFVPDPNTRMNGILAGEYDFGELSTTQAEEQGAIAGYEVEWIARNLWINYGLSIKSENGAKLFSDKKVRQALFFAVDRESIVNDLMGGTVSIGYTPLTPSSPYHNPDVEKFEYDLEKAKSMLDEAGWVDSDGDGIRDKDGVKFSMTFMNRTSRPERVQIAEVIQSMYKDLGVEVLMTAREDKAWIEEWISGDWDATVAGWIIPADPSITGMYACDGSNNMTGFCNEEVDALMKEADQTLDFEKRKELMFAAQELVTDDAVAMVLYYVATPTAYTKALQNFKSSGTNIGSFWNVYEWDLVP